MRKAIFFRRSGMTLVEILIAMSVTSIMVAGLTLGSMMLHRSFRAVRHHATNQIQQLRLMDYISLDLRRAVKIDKRTDGGMNMQVPSYYIPRVSSRAIPGYYDVADTPRQPYIKGSY